MAEKKNCIKNDNSKNDVTCVQTAFDGSGGGISASKMTVLMASTTVGLFLTLAVFAALSSINEGDNNDERQQNFLKTTGLIIITFVLLMFFIGVVIAL
ncbi:MAG: hypothetical protein Q4A74_04740 [Cardiobacteriaceae bacterium]|nr:hypothetical protein [Cardiobacteriaceae bacterium]